MIATRSPDVVCQIAGVRVAVGGLPAGLRARLRDLLAPFATPAALRVPSEGAITITLRPDAAAGWVVVTPDGGARQFGDPDHLLRHLEWLVASQAIAASATRAAFHAAALTRDDETLLLLAKSGAGKTTLTLGLMARGWAPLADDIALLDAETLAITAFPRCFHIAGATAALLPVPGMVAPHGKLAGYARPLAWPAGAHVPTRIITVQRCETCPSTREVATLAEGAGALLSQALDTRLAPSRVAEVAARVAAGTRGCYRLRNGRLEGALNLIESALAR
ncbi:MAG TPA: hypothetical protein VGR57_10885 [Ktedonobacterales bacterium]|nr:hypothetical protein [Ktedonobacterales bacterium]